VTNRIRPRGPEPVTRKIITYVTDTEYDLIATAARSRPGRPWSVSRFVAEATLAAARPGEASATLDRPPGRAPARLVLAELAAAVAALDRSTAALDRLDRHGRTDPGSTGAEEPAAAAVRAALMRLTELADRAARDLG
jgi:hypothetical protein